jgi:alkylation response protein AidB-like acyl-CoA dehydrogenase
MLRRFSAIRVATPTFARLLSTSTEHTTKTFDLFNPTEEHASLRQMLRTFVETEVDPQANQYNREEKFNMELFKKVGNLGLLGITADTECGGSGMDALAAVITHGKFSLVISIFVTHILLFIVFRGIIRGRSSFLFILSCSLDVIRE